MFRLSSYVFKLGSHIKFPTSFPNLSPPSPTYLRHLRPTVSLNKLYIPSPAQSRTLSIASSLPRHGTVGIVYVDKNLKNGVAPKVHSIYRIRKAWSNQPIPQLGAQLREPDGGRVMRSGWVRKAQNGTILAHIANREPVYGRVTEIEPFHWLGVSCCWGIMNWWVAAEDRSMMHDDDISHHLIEFAKMIIRKCRW